MKTIATKKMISIALWASVFALQPIIAQTHKTKSSGTKSAGVMNSFTVVKYQPAGPGDPYTKVMFATSDKVFKLPAKANPAYAKRLKESFDKHTPVYVKRSSEQSDLIQSVIVPGTPGQKKKKK